MADTKQKGSENMSTLSKVLWAGYFVFAAWFIYSHRHQHLFLSDGPKGILRLAIWAAFVAFTAYSFYCSLREDLFKTVRKISAFYWGRQIGIDLYLGLSLSLGVIYFHEGSIVAVLIWILPVLIYANQVTLLYFAVNFDSIVARLSAGHY
jgi:hypothetical protein